MGAKGGGRRRITAAVISRAHPRHLRACRGDAAGVITAVSRIVADNAWLFALRSRGHQIRRFQGVGQEYCLLGVICAPVSG